MSLSPEAIYHALPQGPAVLLPSDIALDAEDDVNDIEPEPPADAGIRWVHFVLGGAVLLPWNAMITATPYFLSRLASSPLKPAFSSYMSASFTASNFVFLAHATMTSKERLPNRVIVHTLLWLFMLTALLALSTFIPMPPTVFFLFVLANGIAQAALGSYLQAAVIAIASLFGPAMVQATMSGQAGVAIIVSSVQVIGALASTKNAKFATNVPQEPEEKSAMMFFSFSALFFLAALAAQQWASRRPGYRQILSSLDAQRVPLLDPSDPDEVRGLVSAGRDKDAVDKLQIWRVAKANVVYEIAVAYVFVVTLSVFPPITISIQSTNPSRNPLVFSAVHFLVFGMGDFLGRYACAFPRLIIWSAPRILTISLSRTFFIPLFLACNVQRPSSGSTLPLINSDVLFMLILLTFGMSNGYVSSLCMMAAPSLDNNPRLRGRREDVDIAATVATFCLVGGLAFGSIMSFAVRGAVCQCNPFTQ